MFIVFIYGGFFNEFIDIDIFKNYVVIRYFYILFIDLFLY